MRITREVDTHRAYQPLLLCFISPRINTIEVRNTEPEESLLPVWIRHKNRLYLAKLLDGTCTQFSMPIAARLHPAKRQLNFGTRCRRIEVDQAGLDIAHSAEGQATALGENGR